MKKLLIPVLVAALLLCAVFAACGNNNGDSTTRSSTSSTSSDVSDLSGSDGSLNDTTMPIETALTDITDGMGSETFLDPQNGRVSDTSTTLSSTR